MAKKYTTHFRIFPCPFTKYRYSCYIDQGENVVYMFSLGFILLMIVKKRKTNDSQTITLKPKL